MADQTATVYGASDDLIEIEGGIYEEFTYRDDEGTGELVAFGDGTVLRVTYTHDGVWRIAPVARGTATLSIVQAPEGDEHNYSDRATLTGDLRWAVHCTRFVRAKGGA
jgi:hypothetical protein